MLLILGSSSVKVRQQHAVGAPVPHIGWHILYVSRCIGPLSRCLLAQLLPCPCFIRWLAGRACRLRDAKRRLAARLGFGSR